MHWRTPTPAASQASIRHEKRNSLSALVGLVRTAITAIHVYGETPDPGDPTQGVEADAEGIAFAGQKLEGYLRERAWEC